MPWSAAIFGLRMEKHTLRFTDTLGGSGLTAAGPIWQAVSRSEACVSSSRARTLICAYAQTRCSRARARSNLWLAHERIADSSGAEGALNLRILYCRVRVRASLFLACVTPTAINLPNLATHVVRGACVCPQHNTLIGVSHLCGSEQTIKCKEEH